MVTHEITQREECARHEALLFLTTFSRSFNTSVDVHVNALCSKSHSLGHLSLHSVTQLSNAYRYNNFCALMQPYGFECAISRGGGGK